MELRTGSGSALLANPPFAARSGNSRDQDAWPVRGPPQTLLAQVGTGGGVEVGSHHSWTVTAPTNVLYMSMNAVNSNFTGNWGQLLVTVTITTLQVTVKGFTVPNGSGPYQVAERQMLAKIPGAMVLPFWHSSCLLLFTPLPSTRAKPACRPVSGGP